MEPCNFRYLVPQEWVVAITAIRLLVVDDSATLRAVVEEIVGREPGCHVVGTASDADGARQMLPDVKPNLITLDLNMPGGGGMTFLRELKGVRHAPVVVLSSSTHDGSDTVEEALAAGADACFDKARVIADAPRFLRLLRRAVKRGWHS